MKTIKMQCSTSHYKKILILFLFVFFVDTSLSSQYIYHYVFNPERGIVNSVEEPYREEICLNGSWQFMPIYSNEISDFKKPDDFKCDKTPLKIPSPWNVNSFAQGDGGDFVTFPSYPKLWESAAIGWMKKDFELPTGFENKELILHFEAIAGYAKIYVNGQLIKENLNIFLPTDIDVTSYLNKGKNEILVGVAKASLLDRKGKYGQRIYVAGSFWGQHIVGIWQDVFLIALPKINIYNVYINPDVKNDSLVLSVKIKNNTQVTQGIYLSAMIRAWQKPITNDINLAPVDNGVLGNDIFSIKNTNDLQIVQAGDSITVHLSKKINGLLQHWTPDIPNLYGAIINLTTDNGKVIDKKYTRFGWRQFTIEGNKLLLNGTPIVLKGDAWHFMGVPQMTRRYAWGWFQMLKDANANAVRLHAQPYPSFYLDVADEMGICVLDETGIWASDGGPKIDSEEYWESCKKQVTDLVLRDRNHPSVFGWSVCNENLPVDMYVFHAPDSLVQRNVQEINSWIKIVRKLDPSRNWISGDGDTMLPTNLPIVIGHYGDEHAMEQWSSEGKPWGMGEAGMAYYGTPRQVATINRDRAYESQKGRMEGLATEAYNLIREEREYHAVYASIFNIVWYGLKPIALGLKDTTRAPRPTDGIFFMPYKEGLPGVQPERIGAYATSINPGYDPRFPVYKPWALFYAVQAANANPIKKFKIAESLSSVNSINSDKTHIEKVGFIGGSNSPLKNWLDSIGVPFVNLKGNTLQMLIVDGETVNIDNCNNSSIHNCLQSGGMILICGVSTHTLKQLNTILPCSLTLTDRQATSFVIQRSDVFLSSLGNKDFYFTEVTKQPVMQHGLSGSIINHGKVLLSACNTDWSKWNNRPEYLKTASVYRSECEKKAYGAAIVKLKDKGTGSIYVTSLDFVKLKPETEKLVKTLLGNLGVVLHGISDNKIHLLSPSGNLEQVCLIGGKVFNEKIMTAKNQEFTKMHELNNCSEIIQADKSGFFNSKQIIQQNEQLIQSKDVYLSFWVNSPRSLLDLLGEPNMPKLDMKVDGAQPCMACVNGVYIRAISPNEFKDLPLNKGWNHIILKFNVQSNINKEMTKINFVSDSKDFIGKLSVLTNCL